MSEQDKKLEHFSYDDGVVKKFLGITLVWGFVGMLVGVIIALQMSSWKFNFELQWLTFGRLRPLHTNAVIFAFGGNAIFAGIYYSTQRLLKTRMFSDLLSKLHFWLWQVVIVSAAVTLPLGISSAKEYAELEWPIDILIALTWVVFAVNFFGTLIKRREKHIYVAIWFYIATIITVAVLHIVNSISLPVTLFQSYPIYAGAQDALVQWWYGHNAVAFFLTTPFLGLMYYFIPKAVERPIYSYRLSIIHFWSLVFIYIWAGPHHLLNTALPDWAQTLGTVFSVMLIAPSWGGMINGLLTLRGAWDKVQSEPILKFMAAGITFYGMSTLEGPLLSVRSVSAITHYTDYIIGHVHGGTLGWNGFLISGMAYYLVPKLWKTKLYSKPMANTHFWLGLSGIMLYVVALWAAGITQALMLRGMDPATGKLLYPDFMETVVRILPLYHVRAVGGILYFLGYIVMLYNLVKTIQTAPADQSEDIFAAPALTSAHVEPTKGEHPHRVLEGMPTIFAVLVVIAILVGSVISILPSFLSHEFVGVNSNIKPYSGLELAGRDLYVREGCYVCHSQMIRTLPADVIRYGDYSRPEESMYDHPFQWGSKRTGPDLARLGGKYTNLWHYRHMIDPRVVTPNSIMPAYKWLVTQKTDFAILSKKLQVMKTLGVPYTEDDIAQVGEMALKQAQEIAKDLESQGAPQGLENKEIIAMIAYLQRLGADWKGTSK